MFFSFNQGVDQEAYGESISDTLWVTEFGRILWKNIIYFVSIFSKDFSDAEIYIPIMCTPSVPPNCHYLALTGNVNREKYAW